MQVGNSLELSAVLCTFDVKHFKPIEKLGLKLF